MTVNKQIEQIFILYLYDRLLLYFTIYLPEKIKLK